MVILGIETSCDETAAAVYANNNVLSSILYSQIDLHKVFGGVVPEVASKAHLEKIDFIVRSALVQAKKSISTIDVIAVTNRPGLPGSLLVGTCFAKAVAWASDKKIIAINHLEGHVFSVFLEHVVPFPYLCLTASGGHTSLYLVKDFGIFDCLGTTQDDAAGEAFDKIAKLIGLPYPGGPQIERYAQEAGFQDFFRYPRSKKKDLKFSFSGLKTAVLYDLVKRSAYDLSAKLFLKSDDVDLKRKVASSLLVAVSDIFKEKLTSALQKFPETKAIAFVGGVACNRYICSEIQQLANLHSIPFFTPSPAYCTDNAAMIAFVGSYKAKQKQFSPFSFGIL